MSVEPLVDPEALREQVRDKYREVAVDPDRTFHFHTGPGLAARLGYDPAAVEPLPQRAVESFPGVGNPFSRGRSSPASGWSTWGRERASTASSPPARWARPGG